MSINKDLVAASSTPLVLAILAEGDSYGYAILKRVRELSKGRMEWTDGMLYPVLHRLERLGFIEAHWEKRIVCEVAPSRARTDQMFRRAWSTVCHWRRSSASCPRPASVML